MCLEILFYLKMNLLVILVKFAQQQFLIALCDKHVKYVLQVISVFLVLFSCVEDCVKTPSRYLSISLLGLQVFSTYL